MMASLDRQRGAALLIMMLLVLVAASATLVTRLNSNAGRAQQLSETQEVLAMARRALMDYAAVYPDLTPGAAALLPCPDRDNSGGYLEGAAHADACGSRGETVMGRLPWRSLGIRPLKDSGGACLWYVVSGDYKDAGSSTAEMLNPDANGHLQLHGIEAASVIAGAQADDRPVAMIIAPMHGINGQSRAAPSVTGGQCSTSFNAADFLEADTLSGISNATVSGAADVIELFATAAGYNAAHNDRIAIITRADLANVVEKRHDFDSNMRALGLAVAACVADYARNNPGGGTPGGGPPGGGPPGGGPPGVGPGGNGPPGVGPDGNGPPGGGPPGGWPPGGGPPGGGPPGAGNDYRLPWPAPLSLVDYRIDTAYDDVDASLLSGRLPDIVDDSSAATGNPMGQLLAACDPIAVPAWSPQMLSTWRNWKDHFFYAVAESYSPSAPAPTSCSSCLTVNGAGEYAAIVLFAGARIPSLAQIRNAPPMDTDTKGNPSNYVEDINATSIPYTSGSVDFKSQAATSTFNDLLFCIDDSLNVSEC